MKIEKGIPIPPLKKTPGKNAQVLSRMEINDSILLNCRTSGGSSVQALRAAAYKMGMKVLARKCDEGVRVWRIK